MALETGELHVVVFISQFHELLSGGRARAVALRQLGDGGGAERAVITSHAGALGSGRLQAGSALLPAEGSGVLQHGGRSCHGIVIDTGS